MNKNKKVLVITTSFPRWRKDKVTSFVYHFAERISNTCDVHVLAPHSTGAQQNEMMGGIQVYRFRYAPERYEKFGTGIAIMDVLRTSPFFLLLIPFFVGAATLKATHLLRLNKYDVIHVNWLIPFGPVIGLLRLFYRFRFVITAHGSDVFPFVKNKKGFMSRLVWWAQRFLMVPNIDCLVTVSDALKNALTDVLPSSAGKISVVSMGIDFAGFSNDAERKSLAAPVKLAFVGRLTEIKGVRYLIEAVQILRERQFDVELHIYGDGILRNDLEVQTQRLMLSDRVFFHGFIGHDELPARLAEADIYVGPSITTSLGEAEGFGLVFLEAMAAGLVVIGTNIGGIPDIIKNRETGLLVNEKDAAAIAAAILSIIEDPALRLRMMEQGRALAKRYDWGVIAEKYLRLYEGSAPGL